MATPKVGVRRSKRLTLTCFCAILTLPARSMRRDRPVPGLRAENRRRLKAMCGRFTLTSPEQDLLLHFLLPEAPAREPRYNVAPGQPVAAVRIARDGSQRELVPLSWGLIPSWAKDPKLGARMINARAETAAEKPSFRNAFRRRRCLVPADGFYEWQKSEAGKQPFYIRLQGGGTFAFAGLWEFWRGPEGETIESCALLTTQPNSLLRPLHDRMPVILPRSDYALWLDPEVQTVERLQPLLVPYPAERMEAYPVGRYVNSPENEGPRCIEPLSDSWYKQLPVA